MGQEKKRKTETIKQRTMYIYLPSEEMVERWKSLSNKSGLSLSKFVKEHVENSVAQEYDDSFVSKADLAKQVGNLEQELSKAGEESRMLRALVDKLDSELKLARRTEFLDTDFSGVRKFDRRLVDLLKRKHKVKSTELFSLLDVNPQDVEAAKSINRQLEALEAYGLVGVFPGGWRWDG